MRLIDADALLDTFCDTKYDVSQMYGDDGYSYEAVSKAIESAPTIEPKKGKWIHEGHDAWNNYYRCSCCKHLFGDNSRKHDPYCSHCGAKMIEEQT